MLCVSVFAGADPESFVRGVQKFRIFLICSSYFTEKRGVPYNILSGQTSPRQQNAIEFAGVSMMAPGYGVIYPGERGPDPYLLPLNPRMFGHLIFKGTKW